MDTRSTPSSPIQRPVRLILSAIAVWFAWAVPSIRLGRVLPAEFVGSATFTALVWMTFAAAVVVLAVAHVRRVGASSALEGLLVGIVLTALFIVLDVGHIVLMHPAYLATYGLANIAPYLIVPAITTPVAAFLQRR